MVASALRAFQEGAVNVKALAWVIIEPPFQDIINGILELVAVLSVDQARFSGI